MKLTARDWFTIVPAAAAILKYLNQTMKCAAEHEQFQSAVQALADIAFRQ